MYNVGIFLFKDVELLDYAGPYEVFSVTSELNDHKLFRVFTVSEDGAAVKSVNGLTALPDYGFGNHPPVDILVVPGGVGTRTAYKNEAVLDWVKRVSAGAQIVMSVCSGTRFLGAVGLLDGKEAVTHHSVIGNLQEIAPAAIVVADKRFTDNGKVMTSGGISAGIDLSLHIVTKLYGKETAAKTIKYMEYGDWRTL
ncbi:DJ-1/PfpI family protein [Anaeroselena agilis]|uniref:DJ-1/PfpI family protein n=1 Tax=Anaeroselena agilis TaxID=3063788 RepID=A0ABU3NT38_9FIRM|nr:DJ-1/PfpI family protein [Selenomonadales bacterium 4137-cl]